MVISNYSISGYSKINCHRLLMVNGGVICINGYQQLFYWWILVPIVVKLPQAIGGYFISDYSIVGHWWLYIDGYSIGGY